MHMDFDLEMPDRLEDALASLAGSTADSIVPLAGGTNLMVDLRADRATPERIVDLGAISQLRGVRKIGSRITIGSRTTVTDLLHAAEIADEAPSLHSSATVFAGHMVRNAATVGGNIACGSPAADLVPPLMSLDAEVMLKSASGTRTVALDEYFVGYKKDVRRPDEVITEISWERLPDRSSNLFYKLGRRKGDAITVTGVAVTLCVTGGTCERARIVLGAVAPTVFRARKAEAMLEGEALTPALIEAAAARAAEEASPIDDVRASAGYRLHTAKALTRRLVADAWARLNEG